MGRKMKSVSLSGAWLEFWPVLFPDQPDWQTALQSLVTINVVQFDPNRFLSTAEDTPAVLPQWSQSLSVDVERQGARVSIGDLHVEHSPWFATRLVGFHPQWQVQNPIESWVAHGSQTDATARYWAAQSAEMVRNITLRIGEFIRSVVTKALRDGRLKATGTSSIDGFSKRLPVKDEQLKAIAALDLQNSRIEFPAGTPAIMNVKLSRNPDYKEHPRRGGSFEERDAELVEEMRELITTGIASSVIGAVRRVLDRADRREGASDENVADRLRRAYGRKYPRR